MNTLEEKKVRFFDDQIVESPIKVAERRVPYSAKILGDKTVPEVAKIYGRSVEQYTDL
jgi:hypothetical protein